MPPASIPESNGWKFFLYPAFSDRLDTLVRDIEVLETRNPGDVAGHPKTKLLKRISELVCNEIPRDPNAAEYLLGNTLGPAHRHWRRAKFLGRFRLFFRFSTIHKTIVYAWVNDESTLRKSGAHSDPYSVFARRLKEQNPPDNWDALVRAASRHTK